VQRCQRDLIPIAPWSRACSAKLPRAWQRAIANLGVRVDFIPVIGMGKLAVFTLLKTEGLTACFLRSFSGLDSCMKFVVVRQAGPGLWVGRTATRGR
jgi:hypothetical protein